MAAPSTNLQIFTWLYSNFDNVLTGYVATTSGNIIAAISPAAWTCFGIYILLWGISHLRGLIDEPVGDAVMRMIKIGIVMGFSLNLGRYQSDIVDFFMQTPNAMASVLAFGTTAASGDASTFSTIDALINRTVDVSTIAWNQGGFLDGNFGMYLASIFILVAGLAFAGAAGITIIIGKFATVLLLSLGPIFIVLAMFKTTQRFFESWLGQVLNYVFLLILALAVVTMFMSMMEIILNAAGEYLIAEGTLEAIASTCMVSMACLVLLFQVGPMASALAGGVALATTSAVRRAAGDVAGAPHSVLRNAQALKVMAGAASAVKAKATFGASIAAQQVGKMFRASNQIRRN